MIALLLALAAQPSLTLGMDFTLYRPGVDGESGIGTPYADMFGTGRGPLMGGHIGATHPVPGGFELSLTLGLTHFEDSAKAFVDDGTLKRSGGETSIVVNPVSLMLGARFRLLWEALGLPLVPYVEGGLVYAPWSVSKGDGTSVASGATPGLALGGGLYVELVGVEKRSAKTLRDEFGVESVALRGGVSRMWLDAFGSSSALVLSDTAWTFGLEVGF